MVFSLIEILITYQTVYSNFDEWMICLSYRLNDKLTLYF